jgi:hypothetical protein
MPPNRGTASLSQAETCFWRPSSPPCCPNAPHTNITDHLCVVMSGTWWVTSGADFDPAQCIPVPAGSFVHRLAHTPHYDGVIAGGPEPAIIAICDIAPVDMKYIEPDKPGWRRRG